MQAVTADITGLYIWWRNGKDAVIPKKMADTVLKTATNPQTFSMVFTDSVTDSVIISDGVRSVCVIGVLYCDSRGFTVSLGGRARFEYPEASAEISIDDRRQESQSLTPNAELPIMVSPIPTTVKPMPGFEHRGSARSASLFVHSPSL